MSGQLVVPSPVVAFRLRRAQHAIPACLALVGTVTLGASNGGYFPVAWGWAALALLWVAGIALLVRSKISTTPLELGFLGGLTAFGLWIALSASWSPSSGSLSEAERMLVYVAGVAAVLVVARRRSYAQLLAGAVIGISLVSAYGLATRLFPERLSTYDPIAVYRLSEPIGYWNALGIFAVIGVLLALGFAARGQAAATRALAACAIVLLVPTIYFTFGRGPVWALGIGLVALLALAPRRLQFVTTIFVVGLPAVTVVWLGSRLDALGRQSSPLAEVSRQGHRFALEVLGVMALAAVGMLIYVALEQRAAIPSAVRRAYAVALLLALVVGIAVVFARYGSPPTLIDRAYDSFKAPPVGRAPGTSLSNRFLSLSSNGRIDMWTAARRDFEEHPLAGSGAGSYEQYWLQHRPAPMKVRDAHSVYAETLAELGVIGLAVLLASLAVPLVAAVKARRRRLVPAAFAAYVAYLFHAGVDWDWEMPAVTLTALGCGAAILVAARDEGSVWTLPARARVGASLATVALGTFALVGLIGNSALADSRQAVRAGDWSRGENEARKAIRWLPWSSQGWAQLAEAQMGNDELGSARKSFANALEKDPNDWNLWFDYGLLSTGKDRSRAIKKARELNPLSPEIALTLRALRAAKNGSLAGKK